MNFREKLKEINACFDAIQWAENYTSLQKAWDNCERGDWILWLIGKQAGKPESKSRKKLVLTACKCARLALKHVPKNEKRPLKAIQTAEKWAKGDNNISLQDVRSAAAYAAAAYAADAARNKTLKKCANIVRKNYPKAPKINSKK